MPEAFQSLTEANRGEAARVAREVSKKLFVAHKGGQRTVMASDSRFRVLRAGRRWGKTQLAAHEVIMAAVQNPGAMVWWVANSEKNVRRGYRAVLKQLPRSLVAKDPPSEGANDRIITFHNGATIEFYTAGTPDSLAGEGVDFVVIDEAALITENVWFQLIRPTLADTGGRALIISTPRGRNWFWKLWQRGQKPGGMYDSWHFTSFDNPYIDDEEIEEARETLPDIVFRQEFLAEFVDSAASMFTIPEEYVLEGLSPYSGHVILGVDLAKKEDFTVISGCNAETREPCFYDRFNQIRWSEQEQIIVETVRAIEEEPNVEAVTVVVDSTGVGDVVFDHLEDYGIDVVPVNFGSGQQKERMVRLLAADLEHGRARIIEEMRDEFETYEYEITPNGRYKFSAPEGLHDDKVSAKMLENWGVVHEAPPDIKVSDARIEPGDQEDEDYHARAVEAVRPDSVQDIMERPEAWSSVR